MAISFALETYTRLMERNNGGTEESACTVKRSGERKEGAGGSARCSVYRWERAIRGDEPISFRGEMSAGRRRRGSAKPVNENLLHDNVAIVNVIYNDANIHKSLWQSGASNSRTRWRARCSTAERKVVFGVEYMTA